MDSLASLLRALSRMMNLFSIGCLAKPKSVSDNVAWILRSSRPIVHWHFPTGSGNYLPWITVMRLVLMLEEKNRARSRSVEKRNQVSLIVPGDLVLWDNLYVKQNFMGGCGLLKRSGLVISSYFLPAWVCNGSKKHMKGPYCDLFTLQPIMIFEIPMIHRSSNDQERYYKHCYNYDYDYDHSYRQFVHRIYYTSLTLISSVATLDDVPTNNNKQKGLVIK